MTWVMTYVGESIILDESIICESPFVECVVTQGEADVISVISDKAPHSSMPHYSVYCLPSRCADA